MSGKPLDPITRASRSNLALVQNINRSTRTDWGGKEADQAIIDKLSKEGFEIDLSLATAIRHLVGEQVEGIRKRTSHDREELTRRFENEELIEKVVQTKSNWKPKSIVMLGFKDTKSAVNFFDNGSHQAYPGIDGAQLHKDANLVLMLQSCKSVVI